MLVLAVVIVFSGLSYYEYCFVIAAFNKVSAYLAIPLTFSCFVRLLPVQGLKLCHCLHIESVLEPFSPDALLISGICAH